MHAVSFYANYSYLQFSGFLNLFFFFFSLLDPLTCMCILLYCTYYTEINYVAKTG